MSVAAREPVGYPAANELVKSRRISSPCDPAVADRARLKGGRNEPCPCGSGRKYKKCCLANDEALARHAEAARGTEETARVPAKPLPPYRTPKAKQPRPLSETEIARNALWDAFDEPKEPTSAQMDVLLDNFLALPPDAIDWSDVVHAFADHNHPELPAVFRRICGVVPHTKETGMAFLYWAAAEEFARKKLVTLLPEVAAGFCKLDQHSYDADALAHLQDYLLAHHFDVETLQLAEHFLPTARAGSRDGRLVPRAAPEMCGLIFQLRVGLALRSAPDVGASPELVAQTLRREIEEEIDTEAARRAAMTICGRGPRSAPVRGDFELVKGDISESDVAWQECLNLYDTLMRVAREAWQRESFPPGCGFRGLYNVRESAYDARYKTPGVSAGDVAATQSELIRLSGALET
jgi:hypothetical protein